MEMYFILNMSYQSLHNKTCLKLPLGYEIMFLIIEIAMYCEHLIKNNTRPRF